MKIMICCSKHFYDKILPIKQKLEENGYEIILPDSYEDPFIEERLKQTDTKEHIAWKKYMLIKQGNKVKESDAILVLNFEKNGQKNYIGGATFLEIFKAFELGKKIFMYHPIPKNIFEDELNGINPIIIEGDLEKIVG